MSLPKILSMVGCLLLLSCNGAAAARKKPVPKGKILRRGEMADKAKLKTVTRQKLEANKRLNLREKKEVAKAEIENYRAMRKAGNDEVSNTPEAQLLRNYKLRQRKKKGLFRRKSTSLSSILFPGVSPEEYMPNTEVFIHADLVESRKTQVPFEYYQLPGCPKPIESSLTKRKRQRKNLGSRLQGHDMQPAPFKLFAKQDKPCTPMCVIKLEGKKLRWMRNLISRQYRVQLQLDGLPVLMRSADLNYAIRGYPIGFKREENPPRKPRGRRGRLEDSADMYLYNHLKFTVTYHEDPSNFEGIRITGFDVHPVSIKHDIPKDSGIINESTKSIATCSGMGVENEVSNFLKLDSGNSIPVVYSYDVTWEQNSLPWADRWDVYFIGSPDDNIHYYSILNSFMIVLFMTGAIATILIRTLRKDIAGYNDLQALDEAEETGWKLVHGDVFRPPQFSPMLLSVMVGTGAQIGIAFALAMVLAIFKITSSMKKGQILTSMILLFVLSGSIAGYVSSRIYKFCEASNWKLNSIVTATALPALFVGLFSLLNIFLRIAGAATAVSFLTILVLFLLWVTVSAPLVFVGAFFGLKSPTIEVPTKTKQIARVVPDVPLHMNAILTMFMGGILPFGSVCIEMAFIMSALWLSQIYYVMGFLLAVLGILAVTCSQVSIVLCYLQLCAEDHRWWWKSFMNCAAAGIYLFMYSVWFLSNRLQLVGMLPVVVYLTYMAMISICFSLFCGCMGFLSSFWFTRTIYGQVKVD